MADYSGVSSLAPKFTPQTEAPGYPITIITGGSTALADYTVSFNGGTNTNSSSIIFPIGKHGLAFNALKTYFTNWCFLDIK